jgi:two-component system LytT family response regulator
MASAKPDAILIADDEPLARQTLRAHLSDLGCRSEILEASDGPSAITLANRRRPQLILLDIVMPGATGLEVLQQLAYEPRVIFTTAHDEYAVTAFELGALDYVLKPFGRDRLERAISRARSTVDGASASVFRRAQEALQPAGRVLSRIFVRDGTRIVPVALADIERIQGADDYATIVTRAKEYLVSVRLSDLENHLELGGFLRIHRSHLINLEFVASMHPSTAGRLDVVMKSGAQITASRAGSRRLRDLAY